jgi:hypothetical protein
MPPMTRSQEAAMVSENWGPTRTPYTLACWTAWSQGRGHSWRPSQEPSPRMTVLRFLLRMAPEASSKALHTASAMIMSSSSSPSMFTSSM